MPVPAPLGEPVALPGFAGVRQIAMPLHGGGGGDSVNCWLVQGSDGDTLIDTGGSNEETRRLWLKLERERSGVSRILCTHAHADHVGQAAWLSSASGLPILMSPEETAYFRLRSGQSYAERHTTRTRLLQLAGDLQAGERQLVLPPYSAPFPGTLQHVEADGQFDLGGTSWTLIAGPGHSPRSLNLLDHDRGLLICGDQILADVTPWVGVLDWEPSGDTLGPYLDFLSTMERLPEETIALPGHGSPFAGIASRSRMLRAKHMARAERVLEAAAEPATCLDLMSKVMHGRAGAGSHLMVNLMLATLNFLVGRGDMKREIQEDGRHLFEARRA